MLLVYHHGAVPVDYIYTVAALYLHTGRLVHSIVHRLAGDSLPSPYICRVSAHADGLLHIPRQLLQVPGLQTLAEVFCCSAPSRKEIVKININTTKI